MTLEAINCTHCGSGDVQQVKPDTYFCNHCESISKHVDPSKVTTTPSFCAVGTRSSFSAIYARADRVEVVTSANSIRDGRGSNNPRFSP